MSMSWSTNSYILNELAFIARVIHKERVYSPAEDDISIENSSFSLLFHGNELSPSLILKHSFVFKEQSTNGLLIDDQDPGYITEVI